MICNCIGGNPCPCRRTAAQPWPVGLMVAAPYNRQDELVYGGEREWSWVASMISEDA